MKITAIINSLSGGGAERTLILLAKAWAEAGHNVTIITINPPNQILNLPSGVSHVALGRVKTKQSLIVRIIKIPKLIVALRKSIQDLNPDSLLSFMDQVNILTLLAAKRLNIPVIVSERVYPEYSSLMTIFKSAAFKRLAYCLRNYFYKQAKSIVVQTHRSINYFPKSMQHKVAVIPNPITAPSSEGTSIELPQNSILSLGRLVPQKRFDLIIKAFSTLASEFPDWTLHIAGDGPLRSSLIELIEKQKLSTRIFIYPHQQNTSALYSQASIYVLASDFEGFPVALSEAMFSGVPVIASDCLTGPRELIETNENGLLFQPGSAEDLTACLWALINSPNERANLAVHAKLRIKEFEIDKIALQWLRLL